MVLQDWIFRALRLTLLATMIVVCGIISSLCAFGGTPQALTPNYAGSVDLEHWASLPVTVYFSNDVTFGTTDARSIVLSGFDEWVAATDGVVSYRVVHNRESANIRVVFVSIAVPPTDEFAATSLQTDEMHETTSAQMTIKIWQGMTPDQLRLGLKTTGAHEFGHALGINGHSRNPEDLMYYGRYVMTPADVPVSLSDLNTLKIAYPGLFAAAETRALATAAARSGNMTAPQVTSIGLAAR